MDLQRATEFSQQWELWAQAMKAVVHQAVEQQYPLLIAEALAAYATVVGVYLADCAIMSATWNAPAPTSEPVRADAERMAGEAAEIYRKAGHIQGEIRAKLAIADLLFLGGGKESSQAIGAEVYPQAEIMGYVALARQSKAYADGRPPLEEVLEQSRLVAAGDNDAIALAHDADSITQFARMYQEAVGLPENRLPVIERDVMADRDIARERLNWCRHIELVQDLAHTQHPSTHYRQDPDRHCRCAKHGYETLVGSSDWNVVIKSFKQALCANCPDRSPKG